MLMYYTKSVAAPGLWAGSSSGLEELVCAATAAVLAVEVTFDYVVPVEVALFLAVATARTPAVHACRMGLLLIVLWLCQAKHLLSFECVPLCPKAKAVWVKILYTKKYSLAICGL